MKQQQFLNLASAEEAEERFWQAVQPVPIGEELIHIEHARERILLFCMRQYLYGRGRN